MLLLYVYHANKCSFIAIHSLQLSYETKPLINTNIGLQALQCSLTHLDAIKYET